MVEIQSKEIIDKMSEDLKVQPSMTLPRTLANNIQPTYEVNPDRLIQFAGGGPTDATSTTIHTTHATKDTFLIAATMSTSKSVLSTSTNSSIAVTVFGGAALAMLVTRYEPVTAASNLRQSMNFPMPIKLERGTDINVTNSTAIASIDTRAHVYFFEVDPQ